MAATADSGGFLANNPLSPPPSSHASSSAQQLLPHPRSSPLKPGGQKESSLIRYVDQGLLHVQRRFAKRQFESVGEAGRKGDHSRLDTSLRPEVLALEHADDTTGYNSFGDAAKDLESLVDVIWISGTPSIQIPYLLNLALVVSTYVAELPPSPRSMFRLLSKLDVAFASLLLGRNVETEERLPGAGGFAARGISGTEKVRIKSIVDRTRICVVEALSNHDVVGDDTDDDEYVMDTAPETDDDPDDFNMTMTTDEETDTGTAHGVREVHGDWDMHIAKVYDRTVVVIGDSLQGPPIGIISEP